MAELSFSARAGLSRTSHVAALLSSRRASWTFVATVFLTTLVQVLSTPVTALVEGTTDWGLPLSEPLVLAALVAGCGAQSMALLLSDRWPELAVTIATTVYLVLAVWLTVPTWLVGMYLVIALAMFLLATRRTATSAVLWAIAVSCTSIGVLFLWILSIGTRPQVAIGFVLAEAARLAAPTLGGAALGIWWSAHVARVDHARRVAEQVKRDHDARVQAAQTRERARIAQELHDVAGQHLAGLLMLSDAAVAIAPNQPEDAIQLIRDVRDEGRFAAASLAGALSDLRGVESASIESTSDLRGFSSLVDYWCQRGMTVHVTVLGELDDLPAVVSTTSYRAIQEALTNAAKYAPGAPVNVKLTASISRIEAEILNERPLMGSEPPRTFGLGWGLEGARERVELLGGSLSAGATESGGWSVRFAVPLSHSPHTPRKP